MVEAVNIESLSRSLVDYTKAGFYLVPLSGKRPVEGWGGWQSRDSREALAYIGKNPGNIGIITGRRSRLAVLDYDNQEAGLAFSEDYYDRTGGRTASVQTGGDRGGVHYYFSLPEGQRLKGRNIRFRGERAGELKAEGGLVVAPPSLHPETGREYRFLVGLEELKEWGPEVESLAELEPEPVAEKQLGIRGIADKRGLACAGEVKSRTLVEGERGITLFTLYWILRQNGDHASEAERQIRELNNRAVNKRGELEGISEDRLKGIFKSRKSYKFSCQTIRERLKIDLGTCENCLFHQRKGGKMIGARETVLLLSPELRGLPCQIGFGVKLGEFDLSNKAETARRLGVERESIYPALKKLQEAGISL